ncbi:MAG TPA: DUF4386 domain-containing protein [Ktedonobacterales bacterium]|jgi:hypothetical protein
MAANQLRVGANTRVESIQTYARIAGVLFLLTLVAGGFGEAYAPSQLIVPGDATATAHNLLASDPLFRLGFVAYLVEVVCDVTLTLLLYVLLRPVHPNLALLAVFFRLMGTATFAFGELFYFAPSLILGSDAYLNTFSPDQLNTLALLSFNVYTAAFDLFTVFGVASVLLGYLMLRSGYLPRVLGILWILAGLGFVTRNVVFVLAPDYASSLLLVPNALAVLSLGVWLLVRGVNVVKWNERAALNLSALS